MKPSIRNLLALLLGAGAITAAVRAKRKKRGAHATASAAPEPDKKSKTAASSEKSPAPAGKAHRGALWAVVAVFLAAAAFSAVLSGKVQINYDISDYLPAETQTAKAMELIRQDFGMTGSIQVMASGVSAEQAAGIKAELEAIPHVLTVSFDPDDERSFKGGAALFSVLVDGDDYSENARQVAAGIRNVMAAHTDIPQVEYGGTAIRKQILQDSITKQMVFILALSLCLVVVILLITSRSWLEPLILLAASGVAVLLNRGTNLIFGEISYITNSIAAILQLALSIDYSIVLLHTYRACRGEGQPTGAAMRHAVRQVARPVTASALTTVAGLLALLFMRFRVGFDIGVVLMKGIALSAVTALTLLPALVLLFERAMEKTAKRAFVPQGRAFVGFAKRAGKAVIPVALAAVIVCGTVQASNVYTFSDRSTGAGAIADTFGRNNTVVLVWEKTDRDDEIEAELTARLEQLSAAGGARIVTGTTSYSGTALAPYDRTALVKNMGLTPAMADALLSLATLDRDPAALKLSLPELWQFTRRVLDGEESLFGITPDAGQFDTLLPLAQTLDALLPLADQMLTADELYAALPDSLQEKLDPFLVRLLYGLTFYRQDLTGREVSFRVMLGHLTALCENPALNGLISADTAAELTALRDGVEQAIAAMEAPMTREALRTYCAESLGIDYTAAQIDQIFAAYAAANGQAAGEAAPLLPVLVFMAENGWIRSNLKAAVVRQYQALYSRMVSPVAAEDFFPVLCEVIKGLTGSAPSADLPEWLAEPLYASYFLKTGEIPADFRLRAGSLFAVLATELKENAGLAALLPEGSMSALEALCGLEDAALCKSLVDWQSLVSMLAPLASAADISLDTLRGLVRVLYAAKGAADGVDLARPVPARELVEFLLANAESDPVLAPRLNGSVREKLTAASAALEKARNLFRGEHCTRMLLSADLASEGADATAFAAELDTLLPEVIGGTAYAAGELISTCDLASTFSHDNLLISVFTLVSVFLIVLVLFRSVSLPILLVSVIQGAIFIAMAIARASGGIFFMSYIVSVCILMGATIDYGILMSSSYLAARREHDRGDALRLAVAAAMPTVFSSGLILAVCGFVIHFISTQDAISTVGLLLGIGTVSSVAMITLVLPALLFFLDRFVLSGSWRK